MKRLQLCLIILSILCVGFCVFNISRTLAVNADSNELMFKIKIKNANMQNQDKNLQSIAEYSEKLMKLKNQINPHPNTSYAISAIDSKMKQFNIKPISSVLSPITQMTVQNEETVYTIYQSSILLEFKARYLDAISMLKSLQADTQWFDIRRVELTQSADGVIVTAGINMYAKDIARSAEDKEIIQKSDVVNPFEGIQP